VTPFAQDSGADSRLATSVAGVNLSSPIILAAGTAGTLDEMADVIDLGRVGGIVTKSVTPEPRDGNATWRIVEARGGMLNAIGLANVGLERFLEYYAPRVTSVPTRVFASVAGFSVDDYVRVAGALDEIDGLAAIELNVSCPNVEHGTEFGSDPRLLAQLVGSVRGVVKQKALLVKLSPVPFSPPGMCEIARAAIEPRVASGTTARGGPSDRPGADALVVANTIPAMGIDVRSRKPRLANVTGGLSGPAVHPIVTKLIHDVYRGVARETDTTLIGCGGVLTWEDAAEFVLVGARAVQLGSALFADPRSPRRIARGLSRWVRSQGAESLPDLVGSLHTNGQS